VIDGAKKWIGNGTIADVVVVWARDTADGQVKGFLVEPGMPGYHARLIEGKGSLRAVWQAEITLDGVRVPAENQLPGARSFRDSPIDLLVAAAPHAALETARAVLGGLLTLPQDELEPLLSTFEAWTRASGSANAAGAALYCHPNTVRYRLRRIEAGTGRSLNNPGEVAELVTAVRAWRELPHS
jgi:DNA-binding PucR family transcriptional regulator